MEPIQTHFLKIPIQLCERIATLKSIRTFQLYCYLKSTTNGKIFKLDFEKIKVDLDIKSNKTITKHFEILIAWNWVGLNAKTKVYYIRGFDKVRQLTNVILPISWTKRFKI
jgi:hypothetical protein